MIAVSPPATILSCTDPFWLPPAGRAAACSRAGVCALERCKEADPSPSDAPLPVSLRASIEAFTPHPQLPPLAARPLSRCLLRRGARPSRGASPVEPSVGWRCAQPTRADAVSYDRAPTPRFPPRPLLRRGAEPAARRALGGAARRYGQRRREEERPAVAPAAEGQALLEQPHAEGEGGLRRRRGGGGASPCAPCAARRIARAATPLQRSAPWSASRPHAALSRRSRRARGARGPAVPTPCADAPVP